MSARKNKRRISNAQWEVLVTPQWFKDLFL